MMDAAIEIEKWDIVGPKVMRSFDPETGEEIRFGSIVAEATVAGVKYGAALSCDLAWAEHPEAAPDGAIDALVKLAKMAALDQVGA